MTSSRLLLVATLSSLALALAACVSPPPGVAISKPASNNLTLPPTTVTVPSTSARLLADARKFVYRVRSVACLATGSSFAVAQGIVTNRHVASGSTSLELSSWDGTDFEEQIQAISTGPDLALLNGPGPGGMVKLDTARLPVGTKVWAAGYPLGDQLTVTPGVVVGYPDGTPFGEPSGVMEITNAIQHGNSGGPVLDSAGAVVGVVFALDTLNNDGLAIPAATLTQFLSSPGINTSGQCFADSSQQNSGSNSGAQNNTGTAENSGQSNSGVPNINTSSVSGQFPTWGSRADVRNLFQWHQQQGLFVRLRGLQRGIPVDRHREGVCYR